MKLFLASYHLAPNGKALADLIGENKKIAIIPNAVDVYPDGLRNSQYIQSEKEDLREIGLIPEELNLRQYFGKPEDLKLKLSTIGAVWVIGGNTFTLRRAYKESGMDVWLQEHRHDKDFVYAGFSAGVCVLAPSLKGLETVDEPNIVPDGYNPEVIWEGVGVINFAFAPHFESPGHPETEAVSREVEYYKKRNIEYKALHDGKVIIIDTERE